jgi:hypothetical protein
MEGQIRIESMREAPGNRVIMLTMVLGIRIKRIALKV